ncbi:MAG: 3-oxoacid CoA-transferase subunit B [Treponema sp.]|jgi:acetate CoA/acetoacetate CoA-transferase beta subunit|nr:3-oxoacid CoA-transferase subunit B [Treponema sp.]
MTDIKEIIARRAAMELKDGDVVNLGIGLPIMVADFLPPGINIIFQSENGIMGMGPTPDADKVNPDITNAGGKPVTVKAGAMFFDSAMSFCIIRGGHVDVTILGALEVDESGNIANWIVPGKMVSGMGGAMDLVVGAKKVIVTMTHTQNGKLKILKQCGHPLTALGVVDMIITEMGVFEITGGGLVLTELHPDFSVEQIRQATEARITVSPELKPMLSD